MIIEADGLIKTFKGGVRALDGLGLTVAPGSVYGLLGPNGAGKTTLIRVLATLLPPDQGTARVAGLDVEQDPAGVRATIGLAGQHAAVDEVLTGRENVELIGRLYGLSRRQARRGACEVLERIGLVDAADRQVKTYSGGMRRRLDLAASLVGRPRVLLLDEPTSGLDPASRRELWALIGELPVIFILMFTYVFGGAIQGALPAAAAGSYANWLIPGLLAQFAVFGGAQTAHGLTEDRARGVIDRFRSLPIGRSAVLAGRTLSDLARSGLTLTLMLAVGLAIGFRPQTGLLRLVGALAVGLAMGYAWSWAMALLGLVVRSAEAVQAAVYMVVFPLAFTSSVFVPTQTMPGWLQPFAANQPVTVASNALRGLILGQGALPPGRTVSGQVLLALLWAATITAVFAPLAVRAYRRTLS